MTHSKIQNRILQTVSWCFLLTSCNPITVDYKFAYQNEGPNKQIMSLMESVLENEYNVDILLEEVDRPVEHLDKVKSGEFDFLLHENYSPFTNDGITSAYLVYPRFLHLFYREDESPNSFKDLILGKSIYLEHTQSAESLILKDLMKFFSVPDDAVTYTMDMAQSDVVVQLSPTLPDSYLQSLSGFTLFSFDGIDKLGKGSQVEGISLKYHRLQPYVIPEGTYGTFTKNPIVTLETDMVMLANESIGKIAVHDLIKTVLRNKQSFVSIDPVLYIGLDEVFDRSRLSYPLHDGARAYLDREEPGFLERYAELAGVGFSIIIALITGLISLSRSRVQRKKDRVDVFYKELMDIKNESGNTMDSVKAKIEHIKKSQNKAFDMLINEKLSANESFRIYMELSKETISELRLKRRALKLMADKVKGQNG